MGKLVKSIGGTTLSFLGIIGKIFLFFIRVLYESIKPPFHFKQIYKQIIEIGFYSLPIVSMTAIFTGMVLVLQSYTGFSRFSAEGSIASVVVLSITRELGPVLAGLMVSSRIGSSMAAEIGIMRVTEQIDALKTLSVNPIKYIICPRIISGILTLPILVLIADIIGIFGGYIIAVYKLGFNAANYIDQTLSFLTFPDVLSGVIKAFFFGLILTFMGCYHGFFSTRGAEGVGKSTTNAVVSSAILILCANYFLTLFLFEQ